MEAGNYLNNEMPKKFIAQVQKINRTTSNGGILFPGKTFVLLISCPQKNIVHDLGQTKCTETFFNTLLLIDIVSRFLNLSNKGTIVCPQLIMITNCCIFYYLSGVTKR